MAKLHRLEILFFTEQNGDQLIVLSDQGFVSIDIDHFDVKPMFRPQGLQRLQHIFTKMAIRSRVENELNQELSL
jgi:hypothetical protein